jgi:ribosome-associated protein
LVEETYSGEETTDSLEKVKIAVKESEELKAEDILILNVKNVTTVADYFVILTGETRRQLRAIANRIVKAVRKAKCRIHHVEGYEQGHWILIDLNNVIVHVFDRPTREYYELERLWSDAPVVRLEAV